MKRNLIIGLIEIVGILFLHHILKYWLVEKDIIATLFSTGEHTSTLTLGIAFTFILFRMLAVLCLPGLVFYIVGKALFEYLLEKYPFRQHPEQ